MAALRPFCPIVLPVTSNIFKNDTAPFDVRVLLLTGVPLGLRLSMDRPLPPP